MHEPVEAPEEPEEEEVESATIVPAEEGEPVCGAAADCKRRVIGKCFTCAMDLCPEHVIQASYAGSAVACSTGHLPAPTAPRPFQKN